MMMPSSSVSELSLKDADERFGHLLSPQVCESLLRYLAVTDHKHSFLFLKQGSYHTERPADGGFPLDFSGYNLEGTGSHNVYDNTPPSISPAAFGEPRIEMHRRQNTGISSLPYMMNLSLTPDFAKSLDYPNKDTSSLHTYGRPTMAYNQRPQEPPGWAGSTADASLSHSQFGGDYLLVDPVTQKFLTDNFGQDAEKIVREAKTQWDKNSWYLHYKPENALHPGRFHIAQCQREPCAYHMLKVDGSHPTGSYQGVSMRGNICSFHGGLKSNWTKESRKEIPKT